MKIEDIFDLWSEDSNIDSTDISRASLDIPKLHFKYYKIYSEERLLLRKYIEEKKQLVLLKSEYYKGELPQDELQENGWEPFMKRLLKTDIPQYIDADSDIIKLNLKIAMQQEKVDILESIIKTISNRTFQIKNFIDYERFKVGG